MVVQVAYQPEHRVAPEWSPILDVISKTSYRRRHLRSGGDSALDSLKTQDLPGLDEHVAILVNFPVGLVQRTADLDPLLAARPGAAKPKQQLELPKAAAEDWSAPLAELLLGSGPGCVPVLTPTLRSLQVAVCPQDLSLVLDWLSLQPLVHFLSPVVRTVSNNIFANVISQTGAGPFNISDDPLAYPANLPFWRMGLDGRDQVS